MNPLLFFFGIAVLVVILFVVIGGKNEKLPRFSGRENLTLREIHTQYFLKSGIPCDVFGQLWQELANLMELPSGLLRPDDRFQQELAPDKGNEWDDPVGLVPDLIRRRYKEAGLPVPDINDLQTVRDYIEIASKASIHPGSSSPKTGAP